MRIRPYIADETSKLFELIRTVYDQGIYDKALQRFAWQYEQNPQNVSISPILIIEEGNRVVGMLGAFAQKLKLAGQVYPAFWLGDFMIHPEFRGIRSGLNLAKAMLSKPYITMGFPAENIIKLWCRAGAVPFGRLVEFSKKNSFINRIKNFLPHTSSLEIQMVSTFDHRFDRLWERAGGDYTVIQVRDSRFLNWRFLKCPHVKYFILTAVRNNELLGYITLRHQGPDEGLIVDVFASRSDGHVIDALITAGERFLRKDGCRIVKMVISKDDPLLREVLERNAFTFSGNREQGVFCNKIDVNLSPVLKDPRNWFLTMADSDMDYSV